MSLIQFITTKIKANNLYHWYAIVTGIGLIQVLLLATMNIFAWLIALCLTYFDYSYYVQLGIGDEDSDSN